MKLLSVRGGQVPLGDFGHRERYRYYSDIGESGLRHRDMDNTRLQVAENFRHANMTT